MSKLIARMKGGLGNQLFAYAAAKRLACINDVELVVDNVTGFIRDKKFNRQYMLDVFKITDRLATSSEMMFPFERAQRAFVKTIERRKPFSKRRYICQEIDDFDDRLLNLKLSSPVTYIDGLWQSEKYFKDIESTIRESLTFNIAPDGRDVLNTSRTLSQEESVAIHVRWFHQPGINLHSTNVSKNYYEKAISLVIKKLKNPVFAVFSDRMDFTKASIKFPKDQTIFVENNGALTDFWLMTNCTHFVLANSTYSWWAAWLGTFGKESIVCFPRIKTSKTSWHWDYCGQMPTSWQPIVL